MSDLVIRSTTPIGLRTLSSAQNEDLIGIKDGVAVLVEGNEFVAVFLSDLLAELTDARFLSLLCELILSIHPGLEGSSEGHHHNSEGDLVESSPMVIHTDLGCLSRK